MTPTQDQLKNKNKPTGKVKTTKLFNEGNSINSKEQKEMIGRMERKLKKASNRADKACQDMQFTFPKTTPTLTFCLLVSSAGNLCKQSRLRSGLTKCGV